MLSSPSDEPVLTGANFTGSFQPLDYLIPAEPSGSAIHAVSASHAMLLDLQSYDRQSCGGLTPDESYKQEPAAQLPQYASLQLEASDTQMPDLDSAVPSQQHQQQHSLPSTHSQTEGLFLDSSADHAAESISRQLSRHGVDTNASSSGHSHDNTAEVLAFAFGSGHSQNAAVEDLPFAISSGSSGQASHSSSSSESAAGARAQNQSVVNRSNSTDVSIMQVDQEAVDLSFMSPFSRSISILAGQQSTSGSNDAAAPQFTVDERAQLQPTAAATSPLLPENAAPAAPQLWRGGRSEAAVMSPQPSTGVDGSPHLPVSVVAEVLQLKSL